MELVKLKLKDIHPYPNNPRKNDQAVNAVVESIRQCSYIAPIIVDENHVILAGHTRYKALKKCGWTEAEVIIREGLSEEQKKKYRLLDNKTNEFAEWDLDALEQELEGLDFGELELEWGVEFDNGYDDSFSLPSGEKQSDYVMSFSLNKEQKEKVEAVLSMVKGSEEYRAYGEVTENGNSNGNALYIMAVKLWEQ